MQSQKHPRVKRDKHAGSLAANRKGFQPWRC